MPDEPGVWPEPVVTVDHPVFWIARLFDATTVVLAARAISEYAKYPRFTASLVPEGADPNNLRAIVFQPICWTISRVRVDDELLWLLLN